jgi:predicted Zn-dependent protease with MMP-like domain
MRATSDLPKALEGQNGPMVSMSRKAFEQAVEEALDLIPEHLANLMDNVVVLVEDDPPEGEPDLLGLYDGVALTDRGTDWGYANLPDRIFVYRNPTLAMCESEEEVKEEVAVTVIHEIAHHFGIDDDQLHEWGWA